MKSKIVKLEKSPYFKENDGIYIKKDKYENYLSKTNKIRVKLLCNWCDKCADVCPYSAIVKEVKNGKMFAVVHEANCKGCGMCLPVCPSNAIQLIGYTDIEIESMIEALID